MTRRKKDPLRKLTDQERLWLVRISRSQAEPAAHVARAKALLAVADGQRATPMRPKPPVGALVKPSLI